MATTDTAMGTLSVRAEGRVEVKPDIARIEFSVITEGKTAQEAFGKNADKAVQVFKALKALGIPENEIQTADLTLFAITDETEGPTHGRITGYRAENTVRVRVQIGLAGKVVDAAVAAGANEIANLSFEVKDESAYRAQALKEAVKNAKSEAQVVASAMGLTTQAVRAISIDERYLDTYREKFEVAARATATPIAPGEITVTASVTVVFAIP